MPIVYETGNNIAADERMPFNKFTKLFVQYCFHTLFEYSLNRGKSYKELSPPPPNSILIVSAAIFAQLTSETNTDRQTYRQTE